MASISTRSTVLSVMKESTEGTPVAPSGASSFIAAQPDLALAPATDVLSNDELKSSIGAAKPILGAENPTASFSHYLRSSGVVAQEPNFGNLLEAALGAVSIASTEYDTVASSTTSVIKVDTGEGASFQRGEALLIKDGTNGYRIRCLDSISSDDLTIGFQVPSAPASGVNLGKSVLYYPANSGHPTLSVWQYYGNGGLTQMVSGCRVTSVQFTASAGQLLNGSYSLEGLGFYFNPIILGATDTKLDFVDDDGTWAATIAAGAYKDPHKLAEAIQNAMNDASTQTYTVTYNNSTGKFKIVGTGTLLTLKWNTGANAANTIGDKIGYSTAADDSGTGATTGYSSDTAVSFAAPYTPSYDAEDPYAAKDNEVMVGDTSDYLCFKASEASVSINTPKTDILSLCAESGKSGSIIQSREVTVTVSALIEQYDAAKWKAYRAGDNVKFQYSFGKKSGGNWSAGHCGAIYMPTMTVSEFSIVDNNGLANLNMTLTGYVNSSGEGEVFVNFL
jgi:hypothetical protein